MRWWNELRAPTLKCARVGHVGRLRTRYGYTRGKGGYFGGVANSVSQEREVCARCGVETVAWETVRNRTLTSLTASETILDAIEKTGAWWSDGSHNVAVSESTVRPAQRSEPNPPPTHPLDGGGK